MACGGMPAVTGYPCGLLPKYCPPLGLGPGPSIGATGTSFIIFRTCALSFARRFFSPGSQRWQNSQFTPFPQPLVCLKAHGLQVPKRWLREPTVGTSSVPTSSSGKTCANLSGTGSSVACAQLGGGGGDGLRVGKKSGALVAGGGGKDFTGDVSCGGFTILFGDHAMDATRSSRPSPDMVLGQYCGYSPGDSSTSFSFFGSVVSVSFSTLTSFSPSSSSAFVSDSSSSCGTWLLARPGGAPIALPGHERKPRSS
mmetsp:Transcript_78715/g.138881  ORF Transcript_78715/g.138881 Transcript_78715/m.138881 type:complete len:254 (+) Transcript_78715:163-924(+)